MSYAGRPGIKKPPASHMAAAARAKDAPGTWVTVTTYPADYTARQVASGINRRASNLTAYQPADAFHATTVPTQDGTRLRIRYTGPRIPPPPPTAGNGRPPSPRKHTTRRPEHHPATAHPHATASTTAPTPGPTATHTLGTVDLNSPAVQQRLRLAIADPGAFVTRGDNYTELLPSWQARAVSALLHQLLTPSTEAP